MPHHLENLKKEKRIIDLVHANVYGVLILFPILIVFGVPFYFVWGIETELKLMVIFFSHYYIGFKFLFIFGILLLGIVLHELIHGITWACFAKEGFKYIKFGVIWKMITPYCHCKEALQVKHYITGALMPAILLGILPATMGLLMGNLFLLILGMFFTMAAAGDFMIIYLIRNEKSTHWVQDHPTETGYFVFRKED